MLLLVAIADAWAGASWQTDGRVERATLEAMVARVAPVVEEVAGRRFDGLPPVVLADVPRLERVLVDEQLHLLRRVGGLPPELARAEARRNAADLAGSFVGKYGFLDGNLYVVPEAVTEALTLEGLDPALAPGVLQLVIAHELTHALQDQQRGLDAVVLATGGDDEVVAVNCLVEGHAVWVHEQVGARLGLTDEVLAVARILGYTPGAAVSDDPDRFYTSYVYGQGRDFVDWHSQDGPEAIWGLLARPPGESAMIVHPASYAPEPAEPPGERVRAALRRSRDRLGDPGWSDEEGAVGDYELRRRLLPTDAPPELVDHVVDGWIARRAPPDGFAGAAVELLEFVAQSDASEYVQAMHDNSERLLQTAVRETGGAIQASTEILELPRADLAAREVINLPSAEGQRMSTHWVASGPYVVQVVLVNTSPSERRVTAEIQRVLRTVE